MRVLIVTNMYPTPEEPAFGCFVREQEEDIRQLGVDVRLLAFDGREDWRNYFRAGLRVRSIIARDPVDLVHAHYGLTGAVGLAQRRRPVVTTFHGSDYSGYVPWQVYVSRIVAARTTPIVVSDQGAARLGQPMASVVPAGVDTELFYPISRAEARRRLQWRVDARYVLFPSDPGRRAKRYDLFLAALAEARHRVRNLNGVCLHGLSRAEVACVMNAVDVTLVTSDAEGSPLAVRESLACQTPVVSVAVGDVPSVLTGLPGCAVVHRSAQAVAAALLHALEAGRPEELRHRAELTSRRRIARRIVSVYESVLRDRGG